MSKIANNYGQRAMRVLGARGYARYLLTTVCTLPRILAAGDLGPLDQAMTGTILVRHPVDGRALSIDLDAYRAGDVGEGTYAFGLVREIWLRNIYLRHFSLPRRLGTVVDLGANRGIFTLQAAAIAERVVAVEPLAGYQGPLQANLARNGLSNVDMLACQLGGRGALAVDTVATWRLEDVMERAGGDVDLLKIDIEGSEFGLDLAALHGVRRLAMEVHPQWGDPAALVSRVGALGFECRTYDDALVPTSPTQADFLLAINTRHAEAKWAS